MAGQCEAAFNGFGYDFGSASGAQGIEVLVVLRANEHGYARSQGAYMGEYAQGLG